MSPAFESDLGTVSRFQALAEMYMRQLIWVGVTPAVEISIASKPKAWRTPSSLLFWTAGNYQLRAGGAR